MAVCIYHLLDNIDMLCEGTEERERERCLQGGEAEEEEEVDFFETPQNAFQIDEEN